MKSYLVAFLLAAGAMIAAASPSHAYHEKLAQKAAASKAAVQAAKAKSSKSKKFAAKPAPRKVAAKPAPKRAAAPIRGTLSGIASYYWQPQPVASGGRFNPDALTAAHKTLPFGTRVRVTHGSNGRSVEVVINDRGPYIAGRIIDLSRRAAQVIGMTQQGIARVNVAILGK